MSRQNHEVRLRRPTDLSNAHAPLNKAKVCLDISAAWRDWRAEHRGSIGSHVEDELSQINAVALEAQAEWEKKTRQARFLEIMLSCSDRRRKLLSLDAPSRREDSADLTVSRRFVSKAEMLATVLEHLRRFRDRSGKPNDNEEQK